MLTQEEHEKVVKKLCSLMEKVPSCQELPPLVNQLLQLCRDQHSIIVFLGLRTYFAKKLHNKAEEMLDDSMDAITAGKIFFRHSISFQGRMPPETENHVEHRVATVREYQENAKC